MKYAILWDHLVHIVHYTVVSSGPQSTLYCSVTESAKYVIMWYHPVYKVLYSVVSSGP